jgi:hypothetical protein
LTDKGRTSKGSLSPKVVGIKYKIPLVACIGKEFNYK